MYVSLLRALLETRLSVERPRQPRKIGPSTSLNLDGHC